MPSILAVESLWTGCVWCLKKCVQKVHKPVVTHSPNFGWVSYAQVIQAQATALINRFLGALTSTKLCLCTLSTQPITTTYLYKVVI